MGPFRPCLPNSSGHFALGRPPKSPGLPRVPSGGTFARVPSHETIAPHPVLTIDLAALAALIGPDYPVEALREALLAASTAKIRAGAGVELEVPQLHVSEQDGGVLVSRGPPHPQAPAEEEGKAGPSVASESEGECAGLIASAIPMATGGGDDVDCAPMTDLCEFEEMAQSVPLSFTSVATHLTGVPVHRGFEEQVSEESEMETETCETTTILAAPHIKRTGSNEVSLGLEESDMPDGDDVAMIVPMPSKDQKRPTQSLLLMRGADEDAGAVLVDAPETTHMANPLMTVESEFVLTAASASVPDRGESTPLLEKVATQQQMSLNVTYTINYLGYVILFVAIVCVASQGTAAKWLPNVAGATTATWLMSVQGLLCVPLAAAELALMERKARSATLGALRDSESLRMIVGASAAQVAWASGFFVAVDYSSIARVWTLNNAHSILIVLLVLLTGQYATRGEKVGFGTAVTGIVLMQVPLFFGRGLVPLAGDCVALTSSIAAVVFLDLASRLRTRLPLFSFMAPVSLLNACAFSLVAMVLQGGDFSVSDMGAFGWLATWPRIVFGLYLGAERPLVCFAVF